ncbi:COBRA-like protein [Musa troglodytarum]|uniref:COBRA-like protein n=1 Tax=Musa troglodytarum TaxID=320322 RepID=A0A9E7FKS4_9LILI|nr:COBRA-like protein [Musa troglodytarum]
MHALRGHSIHPSIRARRKRYKEQRGGDKPTSRLPLSSPICLLPLSLLLLHGSAGALLSALTEKMSPATASLSLLLPLLLFCCAGAYDPMDPDGNITIKWDFLTNSGDMYMSSSCSVLAAAPIPINLILSSKEVPVEFSGFRLTFHLRAFLLCQLRHETDEPVRALTRVSVVSVSIYNYQLYRHIERPGWRLGWTWPNDEVIWDMRGAEAINQGNCSKFKGDNIPHCCEKSPTIVDLLPGTPYNMQTKNCCRGGVLSSVTQDQTLAKASFQMSMESANISSPATGKPSNFTLGIPGYTCSNATVVAPTKFQFDNQRTTQALMTWEITCSYSQFRESETPSCCVSLSTFYNSTIVSCPRCSCGDGEQSSFLQLPKGDGGSTTSPVVLCTLHMCPIRVHWHVKESYREYWRVKVTITNFNVYSNYSDWNLVIQHPNFRSILQIFSFSYQPLVHYGEINDTAMFWGIKHYNDMLIQYGENGNVQTEMLLHKDAADFTFSGGWAFPRRLSFNGHDCVMPPPDSYPTLPNGSSTMSSLVHCVSLVLSSFLSSKKSKFEASNPEIAVLVPHQLCSRMVRSDERAFFPFGNPFRIILPKGSYLSLKLRESLFSFEKNLADKLKKLKPKDNADVLTLSWMRLAIEFLSEAYNSLKTLINELQLPVSDWDEKWIDIYLDSSVKLLDICIALSSELSRLNQGQILLQYVLRLVDISTSHPSPEQLKKSHLHLHQWIEHINSKSFKLENCPSVIESLRGTLGLPKVKSSKGKVLMRALYGVKVMTVFICGVFSVMLSGHSKALIGLHISSEDFFWFEAFSDLQAIVNEEIRQRFDSGKVVIFKEIAAVEACASGLCKTISGSGEKEPMQDGIGINHEEEMIAPRKSTNLERQMLQECAINLVNGAKSLGHELDSDGSRYQATSLSFADMLRLAMNKVPIKAGHQKSAKHIDFKPDNVSVSSHFYCYKIRNVDGLLRHHFRDLGMWRNDSRPTAGKQEDCVYSELTCTQWWSSESSFNLFLDPPSGHIGMSET